MTSPFTKGLATGFFSKMTEIQDEERQFNRDKKVALWNQYMESLKDYNNKKQKVGKLNKNVDRLVALGHKADIAYDAVLATQEESNNFGAAIKWIADNKEFYKPAGGSSTPAQGGGIGSAGLPSPAPAGGTPAVGPGSAVQPPPQLQTTSTGAPLPQDDGNFFTKYILGRKTMRATHDNVVGELAGIYGTSPEKITQMLTTTPSVSKPAGMGNLVYDRPSNRALKRDEEIERERRANELNTMNSAKETVRNIIDSSYTNITDPSERESMIDAIRVLANPNAKTEDVVNATKSALNIVKSPEERARLEGALAAIQTDAEVSSTSGLVATKAAGQQLLKLADADPLLVKKGKMEEFSEARNELMRAKTDEEAQAAYKKLSSLLNDPVMALTTKENIENAAEAGMDMTDVDRLYKTVDEGMAELFPDDVTIADGKIVGIKNNPEIMATMIASRAEAIERARDLDDPTQVYEELPSIIYKNFAISKATTIASEAKSARNIDSRVESITQSDEQRAILASWVVRRLIDVGKTKEAREYLDTSSHVPDSQKQALINQLSK